MAALLKSKRVSVVTAHMDTHCNSANSADSIPADVEQIREDNAANDVGEPKHTST